MGSGEGGTFIRGNQSKNDGLMYFNVQLRDPADLSKAKALFEEISLAFKVTDSAKGKVLIMEEVSADFAAIDRRLGESELFTKRHVTKKH
jgi:hypothetical protein